MSGDGLSGACCGADRAGDEQARQLRVTAVSGGEPALSISDRAVEIVFDVSNSMWGQIDGRAKIDIARETLHDQRAGCSRRAS